MWCFEVCVFQCVSFCDHIIVVTANFPQNFILFPLIMLELLLVFSSIAHIISACACLMLSFLLSWLVCVLFGLVMCLFKAIFYFPW